MNVRERFPDGQLYVNLRGFDPRESTLAPGDALRQLSSLVATEGAHPLLLDLLSKDEARELLSRRLGEERLAAEPQAVEEIIARCAHLPLALAIAAARARYAFHCLLRAYAAELEARTSRDWTTRRHDRPHSAHRARDSHLPNPPARPGSAP